MYILENLDMAHVLLIALCAVASIVVAILTVVMAKIWGEITRLRERRHEDRDKLAELNAMFEILKMDIGNLRIEVTAYKTDFERRLTAHKRVVSQFAQRDLRTDD